MTQLRAALVGFAAASSVPPLFLAARALASETTVRGLTDAIVFLGTAFFVFLPVSLLAALIVGMPGFFLGRRLGLVTWWFAAVVGAVAGGVVSVARPANEPIPEALWEYVPLGVVAGLVFWLAWNLGANKTGA